MCGRELLMVQYRGIFFGIKERQCGNNDRCFGGKYHLFLRGKSDERIDNSMYRYNLRKCKVPKFVQSVYFPSLV